MKNFDSRNRHFRFYYCPSLEVDRPLADFCNTIASAADIMQLRQRGHCMIGTVLIAFAGEPLMILVLMAR